jgi:hypothetical protein
MLRCALTNNGNGDDDYGESLDPSDYIGVSDSDSSLLDGVDMGGWLGRGMCPWASAAIFSVFPLPDGAIEGACTGLDVLYMIVMVMTGLHVASILGGALKGD